ncbi:MAG: transporter substrate-binding domain-containing protein [Rhizobacter sp.]|nr:transporter substrate-binding domain-containing protein [Bacteriovorax sp.]
MLKIFLFLFILFTNNTLIACVLIIDTIDIFPFGYIGVDGQTTGMVYEFGNIIAKKEGFTSKNQLRPYPRTILDLKNGTADFVIRYPNSELIQNAIPVATIIGFHSIVVGKAGTKFNSITDLNGKTIGIIRGGVFSDKVF